MPPAVVTGCSTGFGRATSLKLLRSGWRVIATVRRQVDAESLTAEARPHGSDSLHVLSCDITKLDDVARLRAAVAERAPALEAVVNNAGTAYPGPLELLPIDHLRAQFEINVFAQIAVTQAVLPSLRAGRGIIINISSISGRITQPTMGAYSASKFALEALTDALRLELGPFGIRVVSIEPGSFRTAIWKTSRARVADLRELARAGPYAPLISSVERMADEAEHSALPPEVVADLVLRILETPQPRARYGVPTNVQRWIFLRRFMPDWLSDRLIRRALSW